MVASLTLAELLVLHARLIQRTGGLGGVREPGLLEAALARPWATFGGVELHPDLWSKAAALLESLCQNHAFVDGNQRVALVATGLFLERNGYTLMATNEEAAAFILSVARGDSPHATITAWLAAHAMSL